jgi:hypothetical protein
MLAWVVPILPDQPLVWCAAFRSTGQGLPTDAVACYSALRYGVSQMFRKPLQRPPSVEAEPRFDLQVSRRRAGGEVSSICSRVRLHATARPSNSTLTRAATFKGLRA